jgi:hypothetical protein
MVARNAVHLVDVADAGRAPPSWPVLSENITIFFAIKEEHRLLIASFFDVSGDPRASAVLEILPRCAVFASPRSLILRLAGLRESEAVKFHAKRRIESAGQEGRLGLVI